MAANGDYWVSALTADGLIRVVAARTTQTVEEARRRHQTLPTATAALGRVLTATGIIAAGMADGQRVTVRIVGEGPLGFVVADAKQRDAVRGYVKQPRVDLPLNADNKLDVAGAVGLPGWLHIVRDLGLREPYTGTTPLVSGEIGEDFTHYFAVSEQTPSLVALGVLIMPDQTVGAAGGLLVQRLPGADEHMADKLVANAGALSAISRLIERGWNPEDLIAAALQGFEYNVLERSPLRFQCDCSYERALGLLAALGREELAAMVAKKEAAELSCHFCGTRYQIPLQELVTLLQA